MFRIWYSWTAFASEAPASVWFGSFRTEHDSTQFGQICAGILDCGASDAHAARGEQPCRCCGGKADTFLGLALVGARNACDIGGSTVCERQITFDVQTDDEATLCGDKEVSSRRGKRKLQLFPAHERISGTWSSRKYLASVIARHVGERPYLSAGRRRCELAEAHGWCFSLA